MPLTNNNSYVPTMNEFIAHWGQVNAALTPDLVVTTPDQSAMTLAGFVALRDSLQAKFQSVFGFLNDKEIARGGIRLDKAALLAKFNEFNAMLDGYWAGTPFLNARAKAPGISDGEDRFLAPMRDAFSLWQKLNAASPPAGLTLPLELSDGTTVQEFGADIANLQAAYAAEAVAQQNVVLARSERDVILDTARAVMVAYRKIVPARCAQHPTLVETLPEVTPRPGHTPEPVAATAEFVPPDEAKITHEPSPELVEHRFELRGNPGTEYEAEDAVTLGSHTPQEPNEFVTKYGLSQPGTAIAVKVFVVLATGNEAGSHTMVVQRPL